ncbi:MAG: cupin domain-containing protein [Alphaproteobacteria bacterium]|nr:cupin domain-containing protein [Alphaproteobacteria bacterium]
MNMKAPSGRGGARRGAQALRRAPAARRAVAANPADPTHAMGEEIRHVRKAKGLTLNGLARRTGLSIGYLSQVERGLSTLSIKTLKQLSDALGVQVARLYQETRPVPPEERGIVVRADRRRRLSFSGLGITDDLLSPSLDGQLEMLLCTLAPNASSGSAPYAHKGEEAGFILSGTLELWVGKRHFVLRQGDTFTFKSTTPHRYRNPGPVDTVVVWAITPPTF